MRRAIQFSCGASSAVAAKLTIGRYPDAVVVNAFLKEEHADNQRFLDDVEKWLGVPIVRLRDEKYGASAYEVFRRNRFIKSRHGAKCSMVLKRLLLDAWSMPGDIPVIGYRADEKDRADDFIARQPTAEFPLIEAGLGAGDVLAIVERAGIELPWNYRHGYNNANCLGCVKGGMGYWNKIRRDFPERFEEMCKVEEDIGPGAYLFFDRDTGKRFPLRQLDPTAGRHDEPLSECGFACLVAENEINLTERDE